MQAQSLQVRCNRESSTNNNLQTYEVQRRLFYLRSIIHSNSYIFNACIKHWDDLSLKSAQPFSGGIQTKSHQNCTNAYFQWPPFYLQKVLDSSEQPIFASSTQRILFHSKRSTRFPVISVQKHDRERHKQQPTNTTHTNRHIDLN